MHGKTSGMGFIVLAGGEETNALSSRMQSARTGAQHYGLHGPIPSHPDPFRLLLAGNFTSSPPNGR